MEDKPVALPVGAKMPVGAGTYTQITSISAPSTAGAGQTVNITVYIKNKYSAAIGIMVGGALEYGVSPWPTIDFPTDWANVNGGSTKSFSGSFTMPYYPPGKEVIIHAYSYYYGADGSWHFDDEKTKTITVEALEAEFRNLSVAYSKA